MIKKIRRQLRMLFDRRYYFLHRIFPGQTAPHNLSYLPDGFTVRKIEQTGVAVVDNFCTHEEAQALVQLAMDKLVPSAVRQGGKFVQDPGRKSETALVFGPRRRDPALIPFACRAAALVGVPYTHLEAVYVTRYQEGGRYNEHVDYGDHFSVDRLYTVLLYLNDLPEDQGGGTAFPRLNIKVQPKLGRAVSWTNMNPDGSAHVETSHAALPVLNGGEKWTIQFWFHPYKMFDAIEVTPPQTKAGQPIGSATPLPDGASYFTRPAE
jgi:prolyl 4-hydroxylase